jgi:hypothetical protein
VEFKLEDGFSHLYHAVKLEMIFLLITWGFFVNVLKPKEMPFKVRVALDNLWIIFQKKF